MIDERVSVVAVQVYGLGLSWERENALIQMINGVERVMASHMNGPTNAEEWWLNVKCVECRKAWPCPDYTNAQDMLNGLVQFCDYP